MRKCYLAQKGRISSQILKIHLDKCIIFLALKLQLPFQGLWMKNEDCKEPFFSYGKAKSIVKFAELLNYCKKSCKDCQEW